MHRIRENDDRKAQRSLPVSLFYINSFLNCRRYEFTSKIKRMYDDIILSQSQMGEYHEQEDAVSGIYAYYKEMDLNIIEPKGLDVKVLGKSAWPTILYNKAPTNFIIPKELELAVKSYEKYYE
jgi:hypothetical protein